MTHEIAAQGIAWILCHLGAGEAYRVAQRFPESERAAIWAEACRIAGIPTIPARGVAAA